MPKSYKKTVSLIISAFFLGIFAAPAVFAQAPIPVNCDLDNDGYLEIITPPFGNSPENSSSEDVFDF